MERNSYTDLLITSLALILGLGLALAMSGCEVYVGHDSCYGHPEIIHGIPDITLVSHAETFVRDLEQRPRVFGHTSGDHLYYESWTNNRRVAEAWIDDYGVLTVDAKRPGRARITVGASDHCDAYVELSFYVYVVEPAYEASE